LGRYKCCFFVVIWLANDSEDFLANPVAPVPAEWMVARWDICDNGIVTTLQKPNTGPADGDRHRHNPITDAPVDGTQHCMKRRKPAERASAVAHAVRPAAGTAATDLRHA
jgi:hypothetical protein